MAFTTVASLCIILATSRHAANAELRGSAAPTRPLVAASWVHARDVKRSLADVLDDALGHEHRKATDVHVERLTETLRPIYASLAKNNKGLLGHASVRYALHRHFVHKHGMYVKGFEPAGEAWNSSSPVDIMEDKVPAYVQHLFEERLHDGFDLHELALLAATLEHFVYLDAIERLKGSYRLAGFSIDQGLKPEELEGVLDRCMFMNLVVGGNYDTVDKEMFDRQFEVAAQIFPEWPETQSFMREVQESTLESGEGGESGPHGGLIDFAMATKVVEAAVQRYGRFQDRGCRALAKDLVAKEDRGTGRVKLSDFWQGGWQFKESKEYLKMLGALDQTGKMPRVIIANYIASATNCVASSTLYSVCCIDQCEELLGHLERRIVAPYGSPEQIVDIVAALPSPTVQAPRHLAPSLVKHLNEIADGHGGNVPLHGRLFAQWMHHAYPRECPFPATVGTTKPMTADEWLAETNESVIVADEDVATLLQEAEQMKVKDLVDGDMEETLPWLAQEELVFHHHKPSLEHELVVLLRAAGCIGAIISLTFALSKMLARSCKRVRTEAAKV